MHDKPGKISHQFFADCFNGKCGRSGQEVLSGPGFGVDVSLVDLNHGMALAMTSDPLSLIPSLGLQESAWLSVHLMANDMATTGFAPMYGQFVLNLPASFSKTDFQVYWNHIHQFCKSINVAITGGHTGFVEGQNSTVSGGGTLVTIAPRDRIRLSKMAQAGDTILVTKSAAISTAAILAMSFPQTVRNLTGTEIYNLACESFYDTSSLQDALLAAANNGASDEISAMHDVTEGGVLGAIYEMAIASCNGAIIYNESLPVGEVQSAVCAVFGLDPKRCIGAGSVIIACRRESAEKITQRLKSHGIPCTTAGEFCSAAKGIRMVDRHLITEVEYQETDPYWAAFSKAVNAGWK